jgi:octaprenyl-diphosphate synthase
LHDDLVDRSPLRRGKTAAWLRYSPEYAVLAGDYLLARVMTNLSSHGNARLIQYTSQVISDLLEGEWIQDSLVRDWDIKLAQLDRVHNLKTGSLFKWCLRAPFLAAERFDEALHAELEELGTILGLLFQRSDDLLDFGVRNYEGKATLGDLKSGYLNSFSVWLLRDAPRDARDALIKSQTLADAHRALGEGRFAERLAAFDELNQGLIELYAHKLDRLGRLLRDSERGWIDEARALPAPLYWRKK